MPEIEVNASESEAEDGLVRIAHAREISRSQLKSSGTSREDGVEIVLQAKPRDINSTETLRPVRPREINADSHPTNEHQPDVDTIRVVGPKGLALASWGPDAERAAAIRASGTLRPEETNFGGGTAYWDEYFGRREEFTTEFSPEWYCSADALVARGLVPKPLNHPVGRALVVGCGISFAGEVLITQGYSQITLLDISPVAIAELRKRYAEKKEFDFIVGDMCALPLDAASIDLILDKAALDTLLCAGGGHRQAIRALREAGRVLRPGGTLLVVSHSSRVDLLRASSLPWEVTEEVIGSDSDDGSAESRSANGAPAGAVGAGGAAAATAKADLARCLASLHARLPSPAMQRALMQRARAAMAAAGEDPAGRAAARERRLEFAEWVGQLCAEHAPDSSPGLRSALARSLPEGAAAAAAAAEAAAGVSGATEAEREAPGSRAGEATAHVHRCTLAVEDPELSRAVGQLAGVMEDMLSDDFGGGGGLGAESLRALLGSLAGDDAPAGR
jgi:SAM-dependent methyltransferase